MDVVHFSWIINSLLLIFLQGIIRLCAVNSRTHTQFRTNINSRFARSRGPIVSPQFPDPYKKGTKHKYRIQGDRMIINITFISFDVGTVGQKICVDDYVLITYADEKTTRKLCGRSNHTVIGYVMLTMDLLSTPARVDGKTYRGFQAIYTFTPIPPCHSKTYTQRKSMSGTIISPGYPSPGYPPEIVCFYNIISNPGYSIHLYFQDMDILHTEDDSCYKDYLDIFVIRFKRNSRKLWKRLCGQRKHHLLVSNTTNINLKFKTETNKHHRGFVVDYRFVKDKDDTSTKIKNSTETTTQLIISSPKRRGKTKPLRNKNSTSACGEVDHKGFSGSLKFEAKSYAHFNECRWNIQVPNGWHLLIIFAKFHIGLDGLCKDKYILLYDGNPELKKKPIAKLCGQRDKIGKEFISSNSIIVVKLISTSGKLKSVENFQINWSAYLSKSDQCRGFTCAGGTVCIDRAGLSCRQLPRRCLHESVKCDGIRNCGTEDDSDENGCISDAVRYSVLGATCFLFLLFLMSTIVILKSRASERTCSCTNTSPRADVNSPTSRDQGVKGHRFNGSINRDVIEMTSLSTTRLPMSSGLASSRHRYSYEVIVNQEALRASEEPTM